MLAEKDSAVAHWGPYQASISLRTLTIFTKKLHHRCFTRSEIHLWIPLLLKWKSLISLVFPLLLSANSYATTAQKMKFSIMDSSVNGPNPQETADLVTFTEEILNGKLHFLCSEQCSNASLLYMRNFNFPKLHRGRGRPVWRNYQNQIIVKSRRWNLILKELLNYI